MTLYKKIADVGYGWREATEALQCSRQEFERWHEEGKLPPPDGEVESYIFTSWNRAFNEMADGWLPETIEKVKPYIEKWRAEHKAWLKSRRRLKTASKKIYKLWKKFYTGDGLLDVSELRWRRAELLGPAAEILANITHIAQTHNSINDAIKEHNFF
jgi:hypothetical protein